MDRKSIIVLVACFALLMLWSTVIVPKLYPPKPLPPGATNAAPSTATQVLPTAAVTVPPPSAIPAAPTTAPALEVNPSVPEQLLVLTNGDARYTFTSHGGALKQVELVDYPETVAARRGHPPQTAGLATLNAKAPVAVFTVLATPPVEGDGLFSLTTNTATGVRAEKRLTNGLVWVKEFTLGSNYLLTATVRLENHSSNALFLPAQEWVVGTAIPVSGQGSAWASLGLMWYNGAKTEEIVGASHFSPRGFACMPRVPPTEYRGGSNNVVWAAAHNQFFALVAMPEQPADQVVLRQVNLPRPDAEELRQDPQAEQNPVGYVTTLVYPSLTLPPEKSIERKVYLYAGPKEYRTLVRIASRFNNNELDKLMGFGWFGFFAKALLLSMNWVHHSLHFSYGWAIIAITVIIKILFWPLTQASTRSMKRMQELGPQMKALQEKYKDDPQKLSQKQWEFWKKNKVNPMGGCLPMLLQMPVLIGFFYMIRSAIELRGQPFLWVADLAKPDTLFVVPGLGLPFNLLPLLMAGTSVWQAHLTPMSAGTDPMQQKMMRYMPVIMVAIFYGMPAGLTLYYTVQSLLSVVQTKLTRTQPAPAPAAPVLTAPQKKRK
jgi:YidC/Oxa1 family membrane protein insertase